MKNYVITAALAAVAVLGFNATSNAFSPQSLSAQSRTQSMSFGATETVNITLHDGQPNYIVPSGKVLHIEHFIWALESGSTHQSVVIIPANEPAGVGDLLLSFSGSGENIWTPERPIRVLADGFAGLRILNNSVVDWRDVTVVGYLTNS